MKCLDLFGSGRVDRQKRALKVAICKRPEKIDFSGYPLQGCLQFAFILIPVAVDENLDSCKVVLHVENLDCLAQLARIWVGAQF